MHLRSPYYIIVGNIKQLYNIEQKMTIVYKDVLDDIKRNIISGWVQSLHLRAFAPQYRVQYPVKII